MRHRWMGKETKQTGCEMNKDECINLNGEYIEDAKVIL